MQPISVGIIGFGRIGAEHATWLSKCANAKATAVADATPARQQIAQQRGLKTYSSIPDLLRDDSIDAVLVSTPTSMHFEHVQLALNANKHVLVEKPMALDLDQARRMAELAERKKLVLSVFHNRRWDVDFLIVAKHVRENTFGKIINVESRLGYWQSSEGQAARVYRHRWRT